MRPLISPGKTGRQSIRIDRAADVRTHKIKTEIKTLGRVTNMAKGGVIVLKVADIGVSGYQFHTAKDNQERTMIFLDNAATTAGAMAGTALVTFALASNPIGWSVIAMIAVGGVVGGLAGDAAMDAVQNEMLFDKNGKRIKTKLDSFWSRFYELTYP